MKQCSYCGKTYPDEADACAVDAHALAPYVPSLPPRGPFTLPIEVRPREGWATILKLREKPSALRIAAEGLTCYPGGMPALIKWTEIERMEQHALAVNLSQAEAAIHIYRRGVRGNPVVVNVLGLELEPPVIHSVLETCRDRFAAKMLRQTTNLETPEWHFPMEVRLSRDQAHSALKLGGALLGASALCWILSGRWGLILVSPVLIIGAGCLGFGWHRLRDHQPKILFTEESLSYKRGADSWLIKWDDVGSAELVHGTGGIAGRAGMRLVARDTKSTLSANLAGLDRSPQLIFSLVQQMCQR